MSLGTTAWAAPATRPTSGPAAAILPGHGLAEHDFFYDGESRNRRMYIVRHGEIVWSYDDPNGRGEISDAVLMSNGTILFAHQYDYRLQSLRNAWRLPSGNTLVNTWVNEWGGKVDRAAAPAQAIEVTPDRRVFWASNAWLPPVDLGPATTIQILDQQGVPEGVCFGDIK